MVKSWRFYSQKKLVESALIERTDPSGFHPHR